jgi:hypothetical protein
MDRINHVKIASPDPAAIDAFLREVVDIPAGWSLGEVGRLSPRSAVSPARDDRGEFTRDAVLAFRGGPSDPVGFIVGDAQSRGIQLVQAETPRIWAVAIGTRDVEGAHRRCAERDIPTTELRDADWGDDQSITFFYAEVGGIVFEIMRIAARSA